MTKNESSNRHHLLKPEAHWPYSADRCRSRLTLDLIEAHAVRILARGMRTQRLVAFVGAGASMAYGRLTWRDLMAALFSAVNRQTADAKERVRWEELRDQLWPKGESDFLAYGEHPLKAQILSDAWENLIRSDPERQAVRPLPLAGVYDRSGLSTLGSGLQRETTALLKDFHGFIDWMIQRLSDPAANHDEKSLLGNRARREEYQRAADAPAPADRAGLTAIGREIFDLPAWLEPESPAIERLIEQLRVQSIDEDSPVRQLILDWGIRRYMTTNYDNEIERGLHRLSYRDVGDRPRETQRNLFETLNFGSNDTGAALRFALEGPRRHVAVLHLHGDVASPRSLIVTEADYQHLYLDDHPLRDLVNNATLANFAANPMLFVGSDVNEDDVLRPMRQFMSGPGHRRDRMSVALFPATREPSKRALQKAKLLLKYGVYAIHVGEVGATSAYAGDEEAFLKPKRRREIEANWLHLLHNAHDGFKKALGQLDVADAETAQSLAKKTNALRTTIMELGLPERVEGRELALHPSLDFRDELKRLRGRLVDLERAPAEFVFQRARLLLDVTINHVMSCFLCAKLIDLREAAQTLIHRDTRLALIYDGWPVLQPNVLDIAEGGLSLIVQTRHTVAASRASLTGRFATIHPKAGEFDEGLADLCAAVAVAPFHAQYGRRLVVVCAARGFGKGGQSDRLIEVDPSNERPRLQRLLAALGGYAAEPGRHAPAVRVIHINLSFSNELGPIIGMVTAVLHRMAPSPNELPPVKDQLEMLDRGLRQLTAAGNSNRLLIVLGNAGVLFTSRGLAKNGQIRRVLRLLRSPRFERAPFDLLMYVGESQVPQDLRLPEETGTRPDAESPSLLHEPAPRHAAAQPSPVDVDMRRRRRLNRLRIRGEPSQTAPVIVHPLKRSRISDVAAAYFPDLVEELAAREDTDLSGEDLARALYFATGGSRFAQTIILAYLDSAVRGCSSVAQATSEILVKLGDPPSGSAVENAIEVVLDQWASVHQRRCKAGEGVLPKGDLPANISAAMICLCTPFTPSGWIVATEVLWHLSAFSHPVEREVLLTCPRVRKALRDWCENEPTPAPIRPDVESPTEADTIEAVLELLVHWCLLFRIEPRPLPLASGVAGKTFPRSLRSARYRYAPHRHMQRHFLRLMGGRNVEATQWDQFSTSIYASMPDEAPRLRPEVHRTLTEVLETLTKYPVAELALPAEPPPLDDDSSTLAMVLDADRIRAAYYLVRSTYSLGIVSHLAAQSTDVAQPCGHMEHYRRLVRWITHAAQYWEAAYKLQGHADQGAGGLRWARPAVPNHTDARASWHPMGIFYAGELIWLYNECGVISLAQGKLQDAEQVLTLAEHAARKVESDDSGSLHTRIRIHTALVQIERGRPHRARQILQPIANRPNGHPVPPLLATAYLGLIEHIGGNYQLAHDHYKEALDGLRREERARAVAFVLMNKADLERGMHPTRVDDALIIANEAISLAQQGDHEDVRIMATLARVRIHVEARQLHVPGLFEQLSFAEDYASRMDIPRLACDVHGLRARLLLIQGEYRLSAADATAGLEIAAMYDLKLKKARGLLTLAEIYLHRGELSGARSLADMGRAIAASCDYYACVRGFQDLELSLQHVPQSNGMHAARSDTASRPRSP